MRTLNFTLMVLSTTFISGAQATLQDDKNDFRRAEGLCVRALCLGDEDSKKELAAMAEETGNRGLIGKIYKSMKDQGGLGAEGLTSGERATLDHWADTDDIPEAFTALGAILYKTNIARALGYFKKADDRGNGWGAHKLGLHYQQGNNAECKDILQRSSDRRNPLGQYVLGWWYEIKEKDTANALRYYLAGAEQGHQGCLKATSLVRNAYPLRAKLLDFQYDEGGVAAFRKQFDSVKTRTGSPIDFGLKATLNNDSSLVQPMEAKVHKGYEYALRWDFSESTSLRLADTLTIHVEAGGIFGPIAASADVTNVFQWEWKQDTQNRTTRESKGSSSWEVTLKPNVAPHTRLEVSSAIHEASNVLIPFTCKLAIDMPTQGGRYVPALTFRYLLGQDHLITNMTASTISATVRGKLFVEKMLNLDIDYQEFSLKGH